MKTKTRKCGVFVALAAVLLVTAALITSCVEPLSPGGFTVPKDQEREAFVPPPGMGYIEFDLNIESFSVVARTSAPTSSYATLASFGKVEVYVSKNGTSDTFDNLAWDKASPIVVDPSATYTVKLLAYDSASTAAVAAGEDAAVLVGLAGTGATPTITLKEIVDGTGTGVFSWTLTDSVTLGKATLNVVGLSSGADTTYNAWGKDLMAPVLATDPGLTDTLTLKSGYYRMELSLEKAGHADAQIREIIHIWSGYTTTYSKTLSLNPNVHTITYNYKDERVSPEVNPTRTFVHDAAFAHPTGVTTTPQYLNSSNAVDSDYTFAGWFEDDSAFLIPWAVPTKKVLRSKTLYAKWTSGSVPPPDITITVAITYTPKPNMSFTFVEAPATTIPDINAYEVDQDDPKDVVITISSPVSGATYTWDHNGASMGTGTSMTIPFSSDNAFLLEGTHIINVEASGTLVANNEVVITVVIVP